ncbi:HNH homing endonuclease [Vibrio phage phiKT1019]|nr:HNH homing endonuclease [Vibrio phage phiKT1019]
MLKKILGSVYSVDIETKDLYKNTTLIHKGNKKGTFKITINGKIYKVDINYCYILALYELHFETGDEHMYFNIEIQKMKIRKLKSSLEDMVIEIPVFSSPLEKEGYRTISTFPEYEVNEEGIVRKKSDGEVIPHYFHKGTGYYTCRVRDPLLGKNRSVRVHRLIAMAWKKNLNYVVAHYVNHIDGDKSHNYASNVEWCTPSHNTKHACEEGLQKARKYLKKDLETEEITGPMLLGDLGFPVAEIRNWMKRLNRLLPFKKKWEIIEVGGKWESKFGENSWICNEYVGLGVQVKDVSKWEAGEDFLFEFDTQKAAADFTCSDQGRISRLLKSGEQDQIYNGYCFRPKSDKPWDTKPYIPGGQKRKIKISWENGKELIFDNLNLAADHVKLTRQALSRRIKLNLLLDGFRVSYVN